MVKGLKSYFKPYTEESCRDDRLVVTRGRWWGLSKLEKGNQKVQVSSYKISYGGVMYSTVNYSY